MQLKYSRSRRCLWHSFQTAYRPNHLFTAWYALNQWRQCIEVLSCLWNKMHLIYLLLKPNIDVSLWRNSCSGYSAASSGRKDLFTCQGRVHIGRLPQVPPILADCFAWNDSTYTFSRYQRLRIISISVPIHFFKTVFKDIEPETRVSVHHWHLKHRNRYEFPFPCN